jgi:hypothetical protein
VAIREFQVEGEAASEALGLQLQDGFTLGLVRAGIQVIDSLDVARRMQASPELEKCDSSLCLKRLGQLLEVRHILRVRVNVNGNSYRMTARLFGTDGPTPALLPLETQSRFCDVCTVAEAREVMLRLADAIKIPIETPTVVAPIAIVPAPRLVPSRKPFIGVGVGVVALIAGASLILSTDSTPKALPALGGALMGAGLTLSSISLYLLATDPARERPTGVAVALRF